LDFYNVYDGSLKSDIVFYYNL